MVDTTGHKTLTPASEAHTAKSNIAVSDGQGTSQQVTLTKLGFDVKAYEQYNQDITDKSNAIQAITTRLTLPFHAFFGNKVSDNIKDLWAQRTQLNEQVLKLEQLSTQLLAKIQAGCESFQKQFGVEPDFTKIPK
jgi:hypothetical protein